MKTKFKKRNLAKEGSKPVTFYLTKQIIDKIEEISENTGLTKGTIVRFCLESNLNNVEKKIKKGVSHV